MRKAVEQQRSEWRDRKRARRAEWGPQKQRRHNEKCLKRYYEHKASKTPAVLSKHVRLPPQLEPSPPALVDPGTPPLVLSLPTSASCPMTPPGVLEKPPDVLLPAPGVPDTPLSAPTDTPLPATSASCPITPLSDVSNTSLPAAGVPDTPLSDTPDTPLPVTSASYTAPQSKPHPSGRNLKKNGLFTKSPRALRLTLLKAFKGLKSKRSKASIKLKKALLGLFDDISPVKQSLYAKRLGPATLAAKDYMQSQSVPLLCKASVRDGETKKILPKKMAWLHHDMVRGQQEPSVSLRTMYSHRPTNIVSNRHQKFRQCLCDICQNVDVRLEALNRFVEVPINGRDELSELSLCDPVHLECVERECGVCGVQKVRERLSVGVQDPQHNVSWRRWDLVQKGSELIHDLCGLLQSLSLHLFVYRCQFMQFSTLKLRPHPGMAVAVFDFAENFLCQYQDEVQSAHWAYNQVTVHPCVLYYSCPQCGDPVTDYVVVLSDDLTHDAHFVRKVTDIVKDHLRKETMGKCSTLVLFSDGCSSQYKSKLPFFFLAKDSDDIHIERSFFGSRHGKGSCDSCGGVVKQLVTGDILDGCIIQNASSMHQLCASRYSLPKAPLPGKHHRTHCAHTKRSFHLLHPTEIDRSIESRLLRTLPRTQKLHQIRRVDNNTLKSEIWPAFVKAVYRIVPAKIVHSFTPGNVFMFRMFSSPRLMH